MRAWRVHRFGRPSDALELDEVADPVAGPGEVLVRTTASVLNYNEVDGCHGRYLTVNPPVPYTLGMELTGMVEAAGPGGESWLGRRVVATATGAFGAHAELVSCMADMTFDAPAALPGADAAAFFFPFHLAWLGLHERGRVQPGETVLVQAAAGGVGSAAVQLAVAAGARVIAVAGGARKAALCQELGADVAVDHTSADVLEAVNEATGGQGVDLVFDGVGGDTFPTSIRCLARNGRHLMIGFAGGIETEDQAVIVPRALMFGNVSVLGVLLGYSSDTAAVRAASGFNLVPRAVGERIHLALTDLLDRGAIRPVIGARVPFEALPAALDEMDGRTTVGRTLVELR
ncbi:MAG: alcohol dehydrogenase [Acidimicrobiales bacterium]|nr:alcohol dehydrogenase [Acidimicrobiales bacterium]